MHLDPLTWSWEFFDEQNRLCRIVVANRRAERERAFRLAREMRQPIEFESNSDGSGVSHFDVQPETLTLLALDEEENAIGTMSLVFDGEEGLPGDGAFYEELGMLRLKERRLCEITRVVLAPQYAGSSVLLANMFTLGSIYARRVQQAAELVLVANPKQKDFYRRVLGFRTECTQRSMDTTQSPSILMKACVGFQELHDALIDEEHTARTLEYLHRPMSEEDAEYFCVERESAGATHP